TTPLAACSRVHVPSTSPGAEGRFAALADFCAGVPAIDPAEQARRRAHAQALLREAGCSALLLEAGDALRYFTGVGWGRSERPLLYALPAEGPPVLVVPRFERRTLQERLAAEVAILDWYEHESPYALLADALAGARGPAGLRLAVDPWTRQFI